MRKNEKRSYIILIILAILFSIISFVIPISKGITFFVAYTFGIIALLFQAYIIKVCFIKGKDVKSKFYGFPIVQISLIYLVIQLLISLLEMVTTTIIPNWLVIIINTIITAIAIIGCIAADAMKDEIQRQDNNLRQNLSNMRELQLLSKSLVNMCTDENAKIQVKEIADDFRYSDPVSSEMTKEIENNLKLLMNDLQCEIMNENNESIKKLCEEIESKLSERNRICVLNK